MEWTQPPCFHWGPFVVHLHGRTHSTRATKTEASTAGWKRDPVRPGSSPGCPQAPPPRRATSSAKASQSPAWSRSLRSSSTSTVTHSFPLRLPERPQCARRDSGSLRTSLVLVSYWPDLRLPQPPGLAFSSGHMLAPLPAGPLASPRHGWPSPQPRVMNPTQMLTASLTGPPPLVAPPWPLQSQPLPPQPGGTSELYLGSTSLSHSGSPRPLPPSTASQSQVPSGSPISEQD